MKKLLALTMTALLALSLLAACGTPASSVAPSSAPASQPAVSSSVSEPESTPAASATIRVAGLRGPTTMGMVKLMEDAEEGTAGGDYQFEMFGTPDEIMPKLVSGELDAAAIPANLASIIYNNTGAVQVAAINTLGVLYVVETGDTVQSIQDLKGKTVYSTGKGTTPQYAFEAILKENGIDPATDLSIEYKSESTEIAALMGEADADVIAVLPQPYVTGLQMQNEQVRVALSLTEEWEKAFTDSQLVTGVLVVRQEFLADPANAAAFDTFLGEYKDSIAWVNANVADAAELVVKYGIMEKAPAAEKAIPACNIVYIDGGEMQAALGGYLEALYGQEPQAVGGQLPDEAFYYLAG